MRLIGRLVAEHALGACGVRMRQDAPLHLRDLATCDGNYAACMQAGLQIKQLHACRFVALVGIVHTLGTQPTYMVA